MKTSLKEPTAEEILQFVWRDEKIHACAKATAEKNPDHCSYCWELKHIAPTRQCGMRYPLSSEQLAEVYTK